MRFATVATALALLITSSIATPAATLNERSHTFVGGYCSENSGAAGKFYCSTGTQLIKCTSNTVTIAQDCANSCQSAQLGSAYCT